jgi:hypothetical protein
MSLEAAIAKLTETIEKNNALLTAANARGDKALAAIGGGKDAGKDTGKGAGKGATAGKDTAAGKDAAGGKEIDEDAFNKALAKFLGTDDEKLLATRKAFFKSVLAKVDAANAKKIAASDRAQVIEWVKASIKDPEFEIPSDEPGEAEAEEDDLLS